MVLTRCALSIRVDALGDKNAPMVGIEHRATVEARLRQLEGKTGKALSGSAKGKGKDLKYDAPAKGASASYCPTASPRTAPHRTAYRRRVAAHRTMQRPTRFAVIGRTHDRMGPEGRRSRYNTASDVTLEKKKKKRLKH